MWHLLVFFYFVFGAASYVLRRELAQKHAKELPLLTSVFFLCFLLPAIFVMTPFFPHRLDIGLLNFSLLLVGSILFPLANITAFHANKHTDVGIYTIINNASPIFTLLIALPFLQEHVSNFQLIGIVLLVASGGAAAAAQLRARSHTDAEGIIFCVLTAAILGIAVAYERWMLTRVDFGSYLIFGWGSQIIWSAFLARRDLLRLPQLFHTDAETRGTVFLWGLTNVLKACAFITALKLSNASIMSALTDFMAIVAIVAAYFYLKERQHLTTKFIAAGIGIIGLFFIAG